MKKPLVTILDDEIQIRSMLVIALEDAGFSTQSFGRASEFEAALSRLSPDICLVDLGLPDKDGLALVHRLALESGAHIVIISGRSQLQDRITGLDLGADDYITKPFETAELIARLRALLRRGKSNASQKGNRAQFAEWRVDFDLFQLTDPHGETIQISAAEGDVLRLFLSAPNRLHTRETMQEQLGGSAGESFDRALDVRISRLRTKLKEDPKNPRLIKTIYGAGYIFVGKVEWE